jgi:hypothetical protein
MTFIVIAWKFHENGGVETECRETPMATDINRKLCITAAWLGVDSRKELAAAFRRLNPATPFDVQRAHKWMQGRAQPRGRQIYEDWAELVQLDEPADWIADCRVDDFLQRFCDRHGALREALLRRADAFGGAQSRKHGSSRELDLVGSYACYSYSWSPYYRGRLLRGILTISAHTGGQSLRGAYSENLPIGPLNLGGPITGGEGIVAVQLNNPNATPQLVFWLFMPTPPGSVLGGFITGATMITNQPQLSTSRLLMFRLLPGSASEAKSYSYLEPGASVAADLSTLGLVVDSPELVDRAIGAYLDGGRSGGPRSGHGSGLSGST